MVDDEALKRIEKLHQMKLDGVITDSQFEESKEQILRAPKPSPMQQVFSSNGDWTMWIVGPLQRYADFNGRSRRKEFWLFQLIYVPITLVVMLLAGLGLFDLATLILVAVVLGLFIPQLALQVRRFHDQDKSGWFALFNLIPYIGIFIVLIFMLIEGTQGDNQFGPDPKRPES